ncbi:unnamed protein product [Meganyctiphanes norvegica]|uniref:Vitellogenin n=1 Tax=Meganyctiphanes norvegica TaxID=48144 RepID=A0AAV2PKZ4_MEGNR
MKICIFILPFLGVALGLQPGLEYQYKYVGYVGTGIPKISQQMAASAFMTYVKVQVIDKTELRMQFTNTTAGDMNGWDKCEDPESTDYGSINFKPLDEYQEIIEIPWSVKLTAGEMTPFTFPDSDPAWLRNIRRGFTNLLHLPVFAPNLEETPITKMPAFQRYEHSPLGQCLTWYTVTPLLEDFNQEQLYINLLDEDVQTPETDPALEDDLWRLTRSVDFQNCRGLVEAHTMGLQLEGDSSKRNCGELYISRASSGYYILRGSPRGVRIERAIQRGTYIVDHNNIHSRTSQKLELLTVKTLGEQIEVAGTPGAFRQEIQNYRWDTENNDTLSTMMGVEDPEELIQSYKELAQNLFPEMADTMLGGKPFNFTEDMDAFSRAVAIMSKEDLAEIYDNLQGDALKLYLKALATSGLETPYLFLLGKFSNDDIYTHWTSILDFLINIPMNTKSTKLIEPIMNFTMNDLYRSDVLNSLGMINFAGLATRMCLNPCGREKLGETGCEVTECRQPVEETFLPWLEGQFNDSSRSQWEQMVTMMAIHNLNTEKIIPIVRPYVIGQNVTDIRLRVGSILALRKDNLPYATKNEVFQLLTAVFDNYQEHYRVREVAFFVMLHWDPQPVWWHYMALNTWRDPSSHIVNLITSTINAYSKWHSYAERVTAITKPGSPKSLATSFLTYSKIETNEDLMDHFYEFFFSGNDESIFPRMLRGYLRLGFMNQKFNALKFSSHMDGSNGRKFFWNTFARLFGKSTWNKNEHFESVKEMYNNITDILQVEKYESSDSIEAFIHFAIFNGFQGLIPIIFDADDIKLTPEVVMSLLGHLNIQQQIYVNSGRIGHAFATEIGIPILAQFSQPKFFSLSSKSFKKKRGSRMNVDLDLSFRMDRMVQSTSRVLIPWHGKAMISGIESRQVIVLPFSHQINLNPKKRQLTITTRPTDLETKLHFGIFNKPFTVRAPIVMAQRLSSLDDYKLIRNGSHISKQTLLLPSTGFSIGTCWQGDVELTNSGSNVNNLLPRFFTSPDTEDEFNPTNKYYAYRIGINYEKSKSKSFKMMFKFNTGEDVDNKYVGIQGMNTEVNSIHVGLMFNQDKATVIRHYEADLTWANGWTPRYTTKMHLRLHQRPNKMQPPSTMCLYLHTISPRILSLSTIKEYLKMDTDTKIKAEIYYGLKNCATPEPFAKLEGLLSLSDQKKKQLEYPGPKGCKKNLDDPSYFRIPSYDQMRYDIKWQQSSDNDLEQQQSPLMYMTYLQTKIPNIYYYPEDNNIAEGTAVFEAYRKDLNYWSFIYNQAKFNAAGEKIQIPALIEETVISPRPYETTIYDQIVLGYDHPICYITNSQVKTFDEFEFGHELGSCWVVAVQDCKQNSGLVKVRKSEGFEAHILWVVGGMSVEISKDSVMINEKKIGPGTATSQYQVYQVDGGMMVQISWIMAVRVTKDGISTEIHPTYRGSMCGACGNYDGEMYTLSGPRECSYSDYDELMTSWTLVDDCNDEVTDASLSDASLSDASLSNATLSNGTLFDDMNGNFTTEVGNGTEVTTEAPMVVTTVSDLPDDEATESVQLPTNCTKERSYTTADILSSLQESCFEYAYDEKTEGEYTCKSTEPISTCKPGCTAAVPYTVNILYDCVASDGAATKKQEVAGLPEFPTPACHYYTEYQVTQSAGCEA